ncbi:MAG: hypothetical protein OXC57_14350 [Rhodobacteraceae bacterium]|nr:hypothetical protein [Paracoccaceae bacterium]
MRPLHHRRHQTRTRCRLPQGHDPGGRRGVVPTVEIMCRKWASSSRENTNRASIALSGSMAFTMDEEMMMEAPAPSVQWHFLKVF